MKENQVLAEESARRMAKAISAVPKDDFELYSMMMDAVLLGARLARQNSSGGLTSSNPTILSDFRADGSANGRQKAKPPPEHGAAKVN